MKAAKTKSERKQLQADYDERMRLETEHQKRIDKVNEARNKEVDKRNKKLQKEAVSMFGDIGSALFDKEKAAEVAEMLREAGKSEAEISKVISNAKKEVVANAAKDAVLNWGKEIQAQAKNIGLTQGLVDTRLQGSNLNSK